MEMFCGSAEVKHPVFFNAIKYFWSEATQHLIRQGSFHCEQLILNNIITKTDLNAPSLCRMVVISNMVSEVTLYRPDLCYWAKQVLFALCMSPASRNKYISIKLLLFLFAFQWPICSVKPLNSTQKWWKYCKYFIIVFGGSAVSSIIVQYEKPLSIHQLSITTLEVSCDGAAARPSWLLGVKLVCPAQVSGSFQGCCIHG